MDHIIRAVIPVEIAINSAHPSAATISEDDAHRALVDALVISDPALIGNGTFPNHLIFDQIIREKDEIFGDVNITAADAHDTIRAAIERYDFDAFDFIGDDFRAHISKMAATYVLASGLLMEAVAAEQAV